MIKKAYPSALIFFVVYPAGCHTRVGDDAFPDGVHRALPFLSSISTKCKSRFNEWPFLLLKQHRDSRKGTREQL